MGTGETAGDRLQGVDGLLALAYLGVAAATTWPLVRHLTNALPGRTLDAHIHYWNGWWVGEALRQAQTPFFTRNLFFPRGVSLVFHNFAWIHILEWLGLRTMVGGITAYNLAFLLNLALCGWAAFLLVRHLTHDRRAAFLGGLIYQCWPYRMAQLDHPNLISTYAIPLFLYFLLRTLREQEWQAGLLTGFFFALTGYTRWQLLIPASIIGTFILLFTVPHVWACRRDWLRPMLLGAGVALLALTPPALLFGTEWRTTSTELVKEVDEAALQTDVMAYLTPGADHPVFGAVTGPAYERYYGDRSGGRRFPAYLGLTAIVLAALGALRRPREALPWLLAAALMVALALGLNLRVNGRLYPALPMPYRLFKEAFIVRLVRFPDRFSLFTALPMAVLASYGASYAMGVFHRRTGRSPLVVAALVTLLVFGEFLAIPVPLQESRGSPIHALLAADVDDFGILNVPVDAQTCKRYMFEQTLHQRPILQGHVSRLPLDAYDYLDGQPLLKKLRQFDELDPRLTDVSGQLHSLARDDVNYLVLHKRDVGAGRLARWRRYLLSRPRYEDDDIAVFSTSPVGGEDFELMEELATGLGPVRIEGAEACANPGDSLPINVGWGTAESPGQDLVLQLALLSHDGEVAQASEHQVSSGWPTSDWPAHTLAWGYYVVPLDVSLPLASYRMRLGLIDGQTGAMSGPSMTVGTVRITESQCSGSIPAGAMPVNALFDDALRLLGYRIHREEGQLRLTLHWRSQRTMDVDYKVFVHVFDLTSGQPVAQDDAMPRRWRLPTTLWYPGQRVEDEIPIDMQGVVPGTYGVAVGVYDPDTTERLTVVNAGSGFAQDGRLILSGETVRVVEEDR